MERSDDQKYFCVHRLKLSGATSSIFNVFFFFVSANVCLCNSAILIKASYTAKPVYDSYYIILICLVLKSLKVKKKINSVMQSYLFWIINLVHTCDKTILWHEHDGTRRWLCHYVCSAKMLIKQHFNDIYRHGNNDMRKNWSCLYVIQSVIISKMLSKNKCKTPST